jgi:hypothetical protein
MRPLFAVTCLLLAVARPASAQFDPITAIANGFTDVVFQASRVSPQDDAIRPQRGSSLAAFGMELLFELRSLQRRICLPTDSLCEGIKSEVPTRECFIEVTPSGRSITRRASGVDTTEVFARKEINCKPPRMRVEGSIELGVGYSISQRFRISPSMAGDTITGVVREWPSVTFYFTRYTTKDDCGRGLSVLKFSCLSWYSGAKTGIVEADELRLMSGGNTYTASKKGLQAGLVLGTVTDDLLERGDFLRPFPPLEFFVEAGWIYRRMPPLSWEPAASAPAGARTRLNLTGTWIGFGFQMRVRDPKP